MGKAVWYGLTVGSSAEGGTKGTCSVTRTRGSTAGRRRARLVRWGACARAHTAAPATAAAPANSHKHHRPAAS